MTFKDKSLEELEADFKNELQRVQGFLDEELRFNKKVAVELDFRQFRHEMLTNLKCIVDIVSTVDVSLIVGGSKKWKN